ncbi:MAG: complex I subunit 5 family protein, partial [Spirochaetota bacterium]
MNYVVLLVLLPLAGSFLALAGKLTTRHTLFSILAALPFAGMALVLVLTAPAVFSGVELTHNLGDWPEPIGIALHLNGLAWVSSVLVVLIAIVVALASFSDSRYRTHYFFFLQLLVAGMEIVVLTGDLFTMFVGFEIIAIAAYVLIAFDQTDEGLLASLKYLLLSSVGILFFLFGIFLIYRDFGSLALRDIAANAASGELFESRSIHFAVAALCVGIGVRTAFIPFHTWLPEAHAYAPHPVSAMLSGALIKVSLFAMVRILVVFSADYLSELLVWIGASTALLAVIWALAQSDAKRLLAYHSISQMGYVLAAVGAVSAISLTSAFSHALHHAIFKSLLFIVAGAAIHMTGSRDVYEMDPIGRRAPILALCFIAGALSISGVPPFNGF